MLPIEDQVLAVLTRQSLSDSQKEFLEFHCAKRSFQWDKVYSISVQHGVAPLIFFNLRQCSGARERIPPGIVDRWKRKSIENVACKTARARDLARFLKFLASHSVQAMLIKGAVLDFLVYEHPWYVVSTDIDLILRHSWRALNQDDTRRIDAFLSNTEVFPSFPDFEYDTGGHHDLHMMDSLPVDSDRLWDAARRGSFWGQPVWFPSDEDLLVAAVIGSCRKRYLRLKNLCDIAEIIRMRPGLNWDAFARRVEEFGCEGIAYTALLCAKLTVGCEFSQQKIEDLYQSWKRPILRFLATRLASRSFMALQEGAEIMGKSLNLTLALSYASNTLHCAGHRLSTVARISLRKRRAA